MENKNKLGKKMLALAATAGMIGTTLSPVSAAAWSANSPEMIKDRIGNISSVEDLSTYRIIYGDTLWAISQATGLSVTDIVNRYHIPNRDLIFAGKTMSETAKGAGSLNGGSKENTLTHTVVKGDTLYAIASMYNTTVGQIVSWNNINNPDLIFPGEIFKVGEKAQDNINTPTDKKDDVVSNGHVITTPTDNGSTETEKDTDVEDNEVVFDEDDLPGGSHVEIVPEDDKGDTDTEDDEVVFDEDDLPGGSHVEIVPEDNEDDTDTEDDEVVFDEDDLPGGSHVEIVPEDNGDDTGVEDDEIIFDEDDLPGGSHVEIVPEDNEDDIELEDDIDEGDLPSDSNTPLLPEDDYDDEIIYDIDDLPGGSHVEIVP